MSALPAVSPPRQARSRRTLERIVQAAVSILEEEGPEALTVQAIVLRARSSVGSFYARFGGKEDLLAYLGDRIWREAAGRWDDALSTQDWSDVGLRELTQGSVTLLWQAARSRTAALQALDRVPGAAVDAYESFRGHLVAGLASLLLERREEITHEDPESAVPIALAAVLGIVEHDQGPLADRERVTGEATRVLLGYLAPGSVFPHAPEGQVDFFDIWGV